MRRVALCGAGMISHAHAAACRSLGWPIVAVASRTAERAAARAADFGGRPATFDELPGEADLVIVATPPQCHLDDAVRFLAAGVAVVVEKPLCRTLDEADRLVETAAQAGGRLLYAENLAYAPVVTELLARVPGLGQLTRLEVASQQGLPGWGAFTSDEWGGGALFDLGVHPLAVAMLAARVAGAGDVVAVKGELVGGEGHGSDERAHVELHFASGLVADVVSSWRDGPVPRWHAELASESGVLRAEILPQQELEHDGEPVVVAASPTESIPIEALGYLGQLRSFDADLDAGREPLSSATFGRDVLEVVCAAYASAGRGAVVTLPFLGRYDLTPLELWRGG